MPMDVEWARADGRVRDRAGPSDHRPRARGRDVERQPQGEYLWTAGDFGEAIPDVMTPATWSLVQLFISEAMPARVSRGL